MVLGKLPVPGRPAIWIVVGQGPAALGVVRTFLLSSIVFFPLSPSLWETARYRLKYCFKGPLSPKTTNQPTFGVWVRSTVYLEFSLVLSANQSKYLHSSNITCT